MRSPGGAATRSFPCAAEGLVVAADARSVLCVSPVIDPPEHYPLRRLAPPEETRRTRQIWRLAAPWERLEALGVAEVEGFSPSYDGRLWPVYEGDDVRLLACAGGHGSFWPTAVEWTPGAVWLEPRRRADLRPDGASVVPGGPAGPSAPPLRGEPLIAVHLRAARC